MLETWVRSLGREDLLEKEMATHSSILAWRMPWTEEPGELQSTGSQRVGHDWATSLHFTSVLIMFPDVQAGFRKGRGTKDQIANIHWIIKKARVPRKHIFLLYWLRLTFDCEDHNKLWKILKEMEIPDHLTCLLRNLYAGQEATVRTRHRTTDCFQIGKGVRQGCILSPCLLNSYAELNAAWEMLGWRKHKLESQLLGEISITSDMHMIPPLWHKVKSS